MKADPTTVKAIFTGTITPDGNYVFDAESALRLKQLEADKAAQIMLTATLAAAGDGGRSLIPP